MGHPLHSSAYRLLRDHRTPDRTRSTAEPLRTGMALVVVLVVASSFHLSEDRQLALGLLSLDLSEMATVRPIDIRVDDVHVEPDSPDMRADLSTVDVIFALAISHRHVVTFVNT